MSSKGKAGSLIDFRIAVENHEVLGFKYSSLK